MKSFLLALSIAAPLVAACGSAFAADTPLETIIVHSGNLTLDCTPPSDIPSCADLHAKIRANFSPREIQILFGATTATPESLTGDPRLEARYDAFMRGVDVAAYAKRSVAPDAAK